MLEGLILAHAGLFLWKRVQTIEYVGPCGTSEQIRGFHPYTRLFSLSEIYVLSVIFEGSTANGRLLAFELRRKWNDIDGQTVDFNRSKFVLKEMDHLQMRSGSHVLDSVKVGNQQAWPCEG
jgi:hypothetical protein